MNYCQAARRLIPVDALALALTTYPYDLAAVAAELEVTVVACRIENLHPAEPGYLRARIGADEHVA